MSLSRTTEWCCALFAFVVLSLSYASSQPINNFLESNAHEEPGVDGQVYYAMAKAMPRELPPQGVAPFVYRIGTPLLAATLAKSRDWVISAGFDRVNFWFNAVSVVLLLLLLQRHVASAVVRLLVLLAFIVEPHSPVRYSYFQPLSVEPALVAGLLAGLLGIEWFQSKPGSRRAVVVAVIVAIGVAFHEAMLVVGVSALVAGSDASQPGAGRPTWQEKWQAIERNAAWLPLVAGLATLMAIRAWVIATPSDYSATSEALRWLREKSILQYILAWFLVAGPALAVPIYFWRQSRDFLRHRPALVVYLLALAVLAWLGDGHTERFVVMASPVLYVVIGRAISGTPAQVTAGAWAGLVFAQALSSRVYSPIGGPVAAPQIGSEVWERLGWAWTASSLSYDNMWSQFCAPSMRIAYLAWYSVTVGAMFAVLRYSRDADSKVGPSVRAVTWSSARSRVAGLLESHRARSVVIAVVTLLALAPVGWLSRSMFYSTHFDQPSTGYIVYNLARLWTIGILLAAFWTTGMRMARRAPVEAAGWTEGFFEASLVGASAWAIATVLLAAVSIYHVWVVLPLVGIAIFLGASRLAEDFIAGGPGRALSPERGGFFDRLLKLIVVVFAGGLLLTIALWGNFGPDNDVPGNYLPYYDAVLRTHSNGPNGYWVHYFVSKGHGLALLFNVLSDVQGSALASWLVLVLGAGMIWRLAARHASSGQFIGLIGVCLYLLFFAEHGAYAKGHIVRNVLILSLILGYARTLYFRITPSPREALGRLVVIAAIILLSPLAVVLLVPFLMTEAALGAMSGGTEVRRSLFQAGFAVGLVLVVCGYNYVQVGLPELHNMPSAIGQFVDFARLGGWLDPRLAFVDYRLGFLRAALSGIPAVGGPAVLPEALPLPELLRGILNLPTMIWLGGALLIGAVGVTRWRVTGASRDHQLGAGPIWALLYLSACLFVVSALRMFGGGAGSSMARFTDFTTPLGIAAGVVVLTATWSLSMSRRTRGLFAAAIAALAVVSTYHGSTALLSQRWRSSVAFFLGQNPYAAINNEDWDTAIAFRIARAIPAHDKAELLSFLPGFTSVPNTPFQRPDGGVYIKNYTTILYGTEEQAAHAYQAAGVNYFLIDVAGSDVLFAGFAPLFSPESIRSRMRLVRHDESPRRSLYLLTWKTERDPAPGEAFELFLRQWTDKLAAQKESGTYHSAYDEGARHLAKAQ